MSQDKPKPAQKHLRPDPADSGPPPGEPAHSDEIGQDHVSAHEQQVHHRGFTGQEQDGERSVPPGEQGQYGLRREGQAEPWDADSTVGSHNADESDASYTEWRKENPNGDIEEWRRKQTAPGTNVGTPIDHSTNPKSPNKPKGGTE